MNDHNSNGMRYSASNSTQDNPSSEHSAAMSEEDHSTFSQMSADILATALTEGESNMEHQLTANPSCLPARQKESDPALMSGSQDPSKPGAKDLLTTMAQELQEMIIDSLGYNQEQLFELSHVCRTFRAITEKKRFESCMIHWTETGLRSEYHVLETLLKTAKAEEELSTIELQADNQCSQDRPDHGDISSQCDTTNEQGTFSRTKYLKYVGVDCKALSYGDPHQDILHGFERLRPMIGGRFLKALEIYTNNLDQTEVSPWVSDAQFPHVEELHLSTDTCQKLAVNKSGMATRQDIQGSWAHILGLFRPKQVHVHSADALRINDGLRTHSTISILASMLPGTVFCTHQAVIGAACVDPSRVINHIDLLGWKQDPKPWDVGLECRAAVKFYGSNVKNDSNGQGSSLNKNSDCASIPQLIYQGDTVLANIYKFRTNQRTQCRRDEGHYCELQCNTRPQDFVSSKFGRVPH